MNLDHPFAFAKICLDLAQIDAGFPAPKLPTALAAQRQKLVEAATAGRRLEAAE